MPQQWLMFWAVLTITIESLCFFSAAISSVYNVPVGRLMSAPCLTPTPLSANFDIFCQFNYHNKPYICDPSVLTVGALSRTEVEMLDNLLNPLNFTTCFCEDHDHCNASLPRLAIIIVPSTGLESLGACDVSMEFTRPYTLAAAAHIYSEELARYWADGCKADLMIIYIRSFDPGKQNRPYLVPLFRHNYQHLASFSVPQSVARGKTVYSAISGYLSNLGKIVSLKSKDMRSSIPEWAVLVSFGFVALAFVSIYIGNYVTHKIGTSYWQARSSTNTTIRLANDRWRAGFGGGMITRNGSVGHKNPLMFKQFNRHTSANAHLQKI
ncbi:hypothetical protein AB6A40_002082 [Gnathostoma spinigerum]|uniref:Uncharacterized protein n=1 Tax=Gnathostoma spinigerum TaxID=75299 RepID=A0ABD6EER6_9BILA